MFVNVPCRGMFVAGPDEESIQKTSSLRVVLEAEAQRLACRKARSEEREKLTNLIEKMEDTSDMPTNEMTGLGVEFHRVIWSCSRNEYLEEILTSLTTLLFAHSMLTLLRREAREKVVLDSGRALKSAWKQRAPLSLPRSGYMAGAVGGKYVVSGSYRLQM